MSGKSICQEPGTKLSSLWWGKAGMFGRACKNYSSPRTSATSWVFQEVYQLLQQLSPKQTFLSPYTAPFLIALHPVTHFILYIPSPSTWWRNKALNGLFEKLLWNVNWEKGRTLHLKLSIRGFFFLQSGLTWDFLWFPGLFPCVHNQRGKKREKRIP